MKIKLTVFFDGSFWVGIFERSYEGNYEVSKVVFGAEPKDSEIYEFILKNFYKLKFSSAIPTDIVKKTRINPKRLQRKVKKELKTNGVGTKAQNAMKLQQESKKITRKKLSKEKKELDLKRKFQMKQEKKKSKHKGH